MLNFAAVIAALGAGFAMRLANAARPAGNFLFSTLLPERNLPTFSIEGGSMTVRSTMAGLVAMDSPYPPGGMVEASTFLETTAKLGIEVGLNEATLRQMHQLVQALGGGTTAAKEALAQNVLNFTQKVVIQPQLDVSEWLRGLALVDGAIDWTFNNKNLLVDYGRSAGNSLTARTGNDGYGGSASKFWTDVQAARRLLRRNGLRIVIAHPDTIDMIKYNPVNQLQQTGGGGNTFTFRRWITDSAGNETAGVFSQSADDVITIVAYGEEAEIINPSNPETTLVIPFMPTGKLLFVGNNQDVGFRVGDGSTPDPDAATALGYTHIGPTIEGGVPGRWAQVYTPEKEPWSLRGRSAQNMLPVVTVPDKTVVATTEMV